MMKNVFVEGIQGMGKSTLVNHIAATVPEFHVCREGDFSPIDPAWCAWMSEEEYQAVLNRFESIREEIRKNTVREQGYFVVSYTKIITDAPCFYRELEQFEIYNGRKSLPQLKDLIFSRFRRFSETGYLFECSFFQNILDDLILFHFVSDGEIVEFYRELYHLLNNEQFLLLYLYNDDLEETIRTVKAERCDSAGNEVWYPMMLDYFAHSPYGEKHGYGTFEDMITHFRHRQQLELRIIKEVIGDNAVILPAKAWKAEEITALFK